MHWQCTHAYVYRRIKGYLTPPLGGLAQARRPLAGISNLGALKVPRPWREPGHFPAGGVFESPPPPGRPRRAGAPSPSYFYTLVLDGLCHRRSSRGSRYNPLVGCRQVDDTPGVSTCPLFQPLPSTAAVNLNFCPSAAAFLPRAFPPVVHTGVSAGLPPTYCTSEAAAGRTGAAAVVDHPYPWDGSQHPTALFRPLPVDLGELPLPPFCVFSSRRPLCSCGPCRALQAPVVASSEPRARSSVFGTTRGVAT